MHVLKFAYYNIFYIFIPIYVIILLYRIKFYKHPVYSYALCDFLKNENLVKKNHNKILFFLRALILLFLMFLIARPQWVDTNSKINVSGVDIVLAVDVSGSMQVFDDLKDRRTRIKVAKDEAIRFIEKRTDDPIGIVIFAKDVISRSPLTLDKNILKQIVSELEIGYINSEGTSLGTGLATSVNRLIKSKAKSKVIILLTDGVPTPEKIDPDTAIDLAKQFGIKIYTIGIGNPQGSFINHPLFGVQRVRTDIDMQLLEKIAKQTGGQFFMANNPANLRKIYDTIDKLEKTEYQTDIFQNYYEAFLDFIWIFLLILGLELFLKLFIWRSICY
ncbi:VWA domain-containing protein [Candidatus Babeliales bacterium]|nr:VWA domain-containing protein [Candidatus Babeliales bacterium]MCF7899732.1 VWA domain-containing protein [Candidatus Babeliales bacterium]